VETALRAAGFVPVHDDPDVWWSKLMPVSLDLREVFPSPWTVPNAGMTRGERDSVHRLDTWVERGPEGEALP
jgi:hypothetical protein